MFDVPRGPASEQWGSLLTVLSLIGSGSAVTSADVGRMSGLGRTATMQRINQLKAAGLVEESGLAASTGGRAPRQLRFRAEAGRILVGHLETSSILVGVSDLTGRLLTQHEVAADVTVEPELVFEQLSHLFDRVSAELPPRPVWGVAVGFPGVVEFATGRPVVSPLLPAWGDFPMHKRLAERFDAPTWIDQNVNLMALGEHSQAPGRVPPDSIFFKMGAGVGLALICGGKVHRGANGVAGEVGHMLTVRDNQLVCSCGKPQCLEALPSSDALAWLAAEAARNGQSEFLSARLRDGHLLTVEDLIDAVIAGDSRASEIMTGVGDRCGEMLARFVNFFNPSNLVIGGDVARAGDVFLAAIRQAVYRDSLPAATRNLTITSATLGRGAGLRGAAALAIEHLFARETFAAWFAGRSPAGLIELGHAMTPKSQPPRPRTIVRSAAAATGQS